MVSRKNEDRLIPNELPSRETKAAFVSDHVFVRIQKKTIKKMHGDCRIKPITTAFLSNRYESFEQWRDVIFDLIADKTIVGIYIVIKNEWRLKFIKDYIKKGKVNGALIGWFVGFGAKDELNHVEQKLIYYWKGCRLTFDIEDTFGRVKIPAYLSEKSKNTNSRPVKNLNRRTR